MLVYGMYGRTLISERGDFWCKEVDVKVTDNELLSL